MTQPLSESQKENLSNFSQNLSFSSKVHEFSTKKIDITSISLDRLITAYMREGHEFADTDPLGNLSLY